MKITKGILAAFVLGIFLLAYAMFLVSLHQGFLTDLSAQQAFNQRSAENRSTEANSENQTVPSPSTIESPATDIAQDSYYQESEECPPITADNWADLMQQCRMAVAAEDMAGWTLLGVVVGALTVILLGWNITQTKQALKIAREANRDARELGESQVRAYITVSDMRLFYKTNDGTFIARCKIGNSGNSPLRRAEMCVRMRVVCPPEEVVYTEIQSVDFADITPTPPQDMEMLIFPKTVANPTFDAEHNRVNLMWADVEVIFFGLDVFKKEVEEVYVFPFDVPALSGHKPQVNLISASFRGRTLNNQVRELFRKRRRKAKQFAIKREWPLITIDLKGKPEEHTAEDHPEPPSKDLP